MGVRIGRGSFEPQANHENSLNIYLETQMAMSNPERINSKFFSPTKLVPALHGF